MDKRPTKKQRELLSFIDGFIKGYGYGPSYREIMRALEYKSVSTVAIHVNGLIARGWLIKKDNSARSLQVVPPTEAKHSGTQIAANTAEQTIRNKLEELRGSDNQLHATDIAALQRTLELLGYVDQAPSNIV
ncbi:MAG: hypothetical protein WAQ25_04380 [Candidatus Saccharimonas sp.]